MERHATRGVGLAGPSLWLALPRSNLVQELSNLAARHGEADTLSLRDARRIHPDPCTGERDKRPARRARVDCGVGLNEPDLPRLFIQDSGEVPSRLTDDTGSNRMPEAEGIADCDHQIADPDRL